MSFTQTCQSWFGFTKTCQSWCCMARQDSWKKRFLRLTGHLVDTIQQVSDTVHPLHTQDDARRPEVWVEFLLNNVSRPVVDAVAKDVAPLRDGLTEDSPLLLVLTSLKRDSLSFQRASYINFSIILIILLK